MIPETASRADVERVGLALVQLARRSEVRSDDARTLLDRVPADRLVEMACQHRVPGVVFRSLAELGVEEEGFSDVCQPATSAGQIVVVQKPVGGADDAIRESCGGR